MLDLRTLLRGALRGTLTRGQIERAADHYWRTHDFVHRLPPETVADVAPPRRRADRYGMSDEVVTHVLYGSAGAPGCLHVTTPPHGPYDRELRRFPVPPHTHDAANIAVMTRGAAVFLAARAVGGEPVVITAEVGPGSICFYPAGVAHTFVSDTEFDVASCKAVYTAPEREDFATPSALPFHRLPRVTYEEYRAAAQGVSS